MDLKRKRDSVDEEIEKGIKESDDQTQTFGAPIMNIPDSIFIDILLRLPLKEILVCKCICKLWRRLILSPHFASLHFARAQTALLIRILDSSCVPRTFYLIDPSEVDLKSCKECEEDVNVSLNIKLKIPFRNLRTALQTYAMKKRGRVRLKLKDHKFKIVNSYNGFLCLSKPSDNEPLVVCNPVTGEYVNIPESDEADDNFVDCGFGFCPATNKYKVIRIFDSGVKRVINCPIENREMLTSKMAEVHTLGTESWENIGYAPSYYGKLTSPTYLNGNIHWFHHCWDSSSFILAFDFTEECFKNLPPPIFQGSEFSLSDVQHMTMGVLRGNLCLCHLGYYSVSLWVMEEYAIRESWTKLAKVRTSDWGRDIMFHPIDYLRCGSLLMYNYPKNILIHYDLDSNVYNYLKICGSKWKCEAVALIPSFFSLKEAVQDNVGKVFNVRSWCARIKLQGETKALYIKEEEKPNLTYNRLSYWSDEDWEDEE